MYPLTFAKLQKKYPNENTCLQEIVKIRFPDGIPCKTCKSITSHYKITKRKAYACSKCGSHVYPLAGTIFEGTTTPLRTWFFAIFLMTTTRSGVSAKTLQRMTGVTYKTAWRMFKQLRILMATTGDMLEGDVEVDEAFMGGSTRFRKHKFGEAYKGKQILMGMVQRGGKVYIRHIPNTGKWTLLKQIQDNISPKARIYSDEYKGYIQVKYHGYEHESVNHSADEYVRGNAHTQTIENVWSHLKRGITGVYRMVSAKYLQAYADEFAFRFNHRYEGEVMFDILLGQMKNISILYIDKNSVQEKG